MAEIMTDADYKFMMHFVEQLGAVDTFVRLDLHISNRLANVLVLLHLLP